MGRICLFCTFRHVRFQYAMARTREEVVCRRLDMARTRQGVVRRRLDTARTRQQVACRRLDTKIIHLLHHTVASSRENTEGKREERQP